MIRIIKYIILDLIRTRFTIFYTLFLLLTTFALFQLDTEADKVILSLLNVVLLVVPLVSIVFSTIHFYNSYEFIELILAQPINRSSVFLSEYAAVSLSLGLSFLTGVGTPLLFFGADSGVLTLLCSGTMLTFAFVSLAFLASVLTRDKAKAIGIALLFWLYFSLIYDGLVLWIMYAFSNYPLEKLTVALVALNPVDLARITLLLQLDVSALMGYTGAFYQSIFDGYTAILFSVLTLGAWIFLPVFIALRIFKTKDL